MSTHLDNMQGPAVVIETKPAPRPERHRDQKRPAWAKVAKWAKVAFFAATCAGCSEVRYKDLVIRRVLWQSHIGRIEASDGDVKLVVENYDSQSQMVQLAREQNKTIQALAPLAVAP